MSATRKILITDEVHALLPDGLQAMGFDVHYLPKIKPEEVLETIWQYEGLVINSKVYVGKEMIDRATKLKFVCRAGSGLEVIDLEYARIKNIIAFNSPEGNRNAVAEFALGALLNMMRNIGKCNNEVKNHQWKREENRGHELAGKTVGMIAYGNTAQAFAKLLSGFDVRVLAYDKYYHGFSAGHVKEASLEEIAEKADILSLHLPLTLETTWMIDLPYLSGFKKPYWLLNTSRGKVLNMGALLTCIARGSIIGAALDVLENEKINALTAAQQADFNALVESERIFLSPHIAGWTHESKQKIAEVLLAGIQKIYQPSDL
jgi:D-3-phosphoglycerate dehydrogenase / 2-oxoglutarate reductase